MGWLRRWTLQLWTESIIVVRSTEVRGRWRTEHPTSPPVARLRGVSQWKTSSLTGNGEPSARALAPLEGRFAALDRVQASWEGEPEALAVCGLIRRVWIRLS